MSTATDDDNGAVVILVHGTFAYHEEDDADETGSRWWQRSSLFCRQLKEQLDATIVVGSDVFHWSGANRETNRRLAGNLLLEKLLELESQNRSYHIIAHSHGGSVVWAALCSSTWDWFAKPLTNLRTWTTVGTPYLHFVPDLAKLWAVVTLAGLMYVVFEQYQWHIDFWNERAAGTTLSPWVTFCAIQLFYSLVLLLPALWIHVLFRVYKLSEAQSDPRQESDSPKHELAGMAWTTLVVIAISGVLTALAYVAGVFSTARTTVQSNAPHPSTILTSAIFWILLTLVGVTAINLLQLPLRMIACIFRSREAREAWKRYGDRYFCISSVYHDEALRGLSSIRSGIRGPLLPRMPDPGTGVYSNTLGKLTIPEQRAEWVPYHLLWMPWLILRDWVARPVYNNVIAHLIDYYVLGSLARQAQGADINGERLGRVDVLPLVESARQSDTQGRLSDWWASFFLPVQTDGASLQSRYVGLDAAHSMIVSDSTLRVAPHFIQQIRGALGISSPSAASLTQFLARAMNGERNEKAIDNTPIGPMDLLVHTRYFDVSQVVNHLACIVAGRELASIPIDRDALRSAGDTPGSCVNVPQQFIWWCVRGIAFAIILLAPAIAVREAGLRLVFPHSREHSVAWAADVPQALTAAANSIDQVGALNDPHTQHFIRWQAALIANGQKHRAKQFDDALDGLIGNPNQTAAISAMTAEKLAEMGDYQSAESLATSIKMVGDESVASGSDDSKWRERTSSTLHRVQESFRKQIPPPVVATEKGLDRFPGLVAICREMNSPKVQDAVFAEEVFERLTSEVDNAQAQTEPSHLRNIILLLLTCHQFFLENAQRKYADGMLESVAELCDQQSRLCSKGTPSSYAPAIECYVLAAKSCRYPLDNRPQGVRLLVAAEDIARKERVPMDQIRGLSRIAAGYARLGYPAKALEMCKSSEPEYRILVAKEVLAFEYENLAIANMTTNVESVASLLGQIRRATDEQLDLARGSFDGPR